MANPDAIPFTCPKCGASTKANRRTGLLYSHQPPGRLVACNESGAVVVRAQGGMSASLPSLRPEPSEPSEPAPRSVVLEERSTSVRAIPGGLPSLGRRRR
ncbi:hypothetical protein [Streptomyces sp. Da 82-17]|uniref:hypothetical protein n=1 Tax=Streptomyces sp. Da 82-17 TaxID=3377116 RepID=UPI0038D3AC86